MKRIFYKAIGISIWIFSLLPFWAIYIISDVLFVVLYYIVGYRKGVVYSNLNLAFPEKPHKEKKKIAIAFYRYLADMICETVKLSSISAKSIEKRFFLRNPQAITQYLSQGRSVIGLTAHYANWEMALHRLSILAGKHPALVIYKPLSNKYFGEVLNTIRSRFGAHMVPMKQTLRQILSHKDRPHISMFVSDQTPAWTESQYFAPFFNHPTLVFLGVEKMAKKTNFPVIYCKMDRIKRGYYECTFEILFEEPAYAKDHEITASHLHVLETTIRNKPELWLWSHRRWKHQPHQ